MYDAVMASCGDVARRMDSLDRQMDHWIVVAVSLIPLIPLTLIAATDAPSGAPIVIGFIGFFAVALSYGVGRLRSTVYPIVPAKLIDDDWIALPEDEFRDEMINHRRNDFDAMLAAVVRKRRATYFMLGGLAVQSAGLALWAWLALA